MDQIVLTGGPKGEGKTTIATRPLSDCRAVNEFVEPDAIAQGLSAFNTASVSISAGN